MSGDGRGDEGLLGKPMESDSDRDDGSQGSHEEVSLTNSPTPSGVELAWSFCGEADAVDVDLEGDDALAENNPDYVAEAAAPTI